MRCRRCAPWQTRLLPMRMGVALRRRSARWPPNASTARSRCAGSRSLARGHRRLTGHAVWRPDRFQTPMPTGKVWCRPWRGSSLGRGDARRRWPRCRRACRTSLIQAAPISTGSPRRQRPWLARRRETPMQVPRRSLRFTMPTGRRRSRLGLQTPTPNRRGSIFASMEPWSTTQMRPSPAMIFPRHGTATHRRTNPIGPRCCQTCRRCLRTP